MAQDILQNLILVKQVRIRQLIKQAHRDTLVAGREKEGELATTSLEFEYLH